MSCFHIFVSQTYLVAQITVEQISLNLADEINSLKLKNLIFHNEVEVTLNVLKRRIISKFRSSQRFWIALLVSYHLLLTISPLIFHFFTVPCLLQNFYPLGILVLKVNCKANTRNFA